MILYMYVAPGQGQTTPLNKLLMSTESPYHFAHSLQLKKKNSDFIHILMILYIYIAPGQGQKTP